MRKRMKNEIVKRICAGLLVAAMTVQLAACSKEDAADIEVSNIEKAAHVNNGELKGDSTVVGVGDTKVLYDEYRVYSWFLKNQYEDVMSADVWNYNLGTATVGQSAIEDILRLIIQIKVMNKEAAGLGISLGVDEKGDVDYKADQYLATIPPETQAENGITAAIIHQIFEENEVARKVYDVVTGNVEATVDETAMQAAKVLAVFYPAGADNRDAVRAQIDALAADVKKYKGNFYSCVKDKTGSAPKEMIIGRLDKRAALAAAALAMQKYTVSDVVEESDGFYLMYCLKNNTKGLNKVYREQYVADQQNTTFQAAYENWAEKYEVKVSKSLLMDKQE